MHDLAEDESTRDRVVSQIAAGFRERCRVDQDVGHVLAVAEVVEIQCVARQVRHPGPVIEHVADGDLVLAVLLVAGDVVGDGIVDTEYAALDEFVHDEGGDGLGGGVDAERGVDGRAHPLGVAAVVRAVAAGMADGPVEDDRAVASDTHLHSGVYAAVIPVADRSPHRLDPAGADPAGLGWILGADIGHRIKIAGDVDPPQRVR